jgi:hypothetical protein
MPIGSIEFSNRSTPAPPAAGKKLYLTADGKFKSVSPTGAIEDLSNPQSTFIGPTPPSPVVNGTIWINSATYRAHVLLAGVWAEISTA